MDIGYKTKTDIPVNSWKLSAINSVEWHFLLMRLKYFVIITYDTHWNCHHFLQSRFNYFF